MLSERVQRQVDRLLDQAEEAIALRQWKDLRATCEVVLNLDPDNSDAARYRTLADKSLATDVVSDSSTPLTPSRGRTYERDEYGSVFEQSEGGLSLYEDLRSVFKNTFGTGGRINRCGYGFRSFFSRFLSWSGLCSCSPGTEDASLLGGILGFVFNGAGIALGFCSIVRKFHDFDWGGVSIFLLFIPIVNIVIALMLLFRSGTRGNNKHGDELLDVEVGF